MLSSHPAGLPPPVSPFRPNLDALKLDISDDEDGLEVEPQMDKLLANSNVASPALGTSDLGTPPDNPDDSPRPLAQSANTLHPSLPPLTTNRQFLREVVPACQHVWHISYFRAVQPRWSGPTSNRQSQANPNALYKSDSASKTNIRRHPAQHAKTSPQHQRPCRQISLKTR
ncbi:hypothetical protein RSAG8_01297, partial [Rhizoctonia solani AG-8 WAC10335]